MTAANDNIEKLNKLLKQYKTKVVFYSEAIGDYKSFHKGSKQIILEMIAKQAQKGANFRPEGNGIRLDSSLHDFGKIKRKSVNIRIIYRPKVLDNGFIQIEVIAIGPRDNLEVYKAAEKRLPHFFKHFNK